MQRLGTKKLVAFGLEAFSAKSQLLQFNRASPSTAGLSTKS